jgi:sporulation protein YlmC with PRC-barrel domain
MDLPVNVKVYCVDGLCGRSTHIVFKPSSDEVTHVVVETTQAPRTQVLVPVSRVTETTPDSINLSYTRIELAKLQSFIETEFVQVDVSPYMGLPYYVEPYPFPYPQKIPVGHEAIPSGELAVRRGAGVEATDGHVGHVDEFVIDPESDAITHLVLRQGHLWGQREVTIPVSQIDHIEEDTVYLKLDKASIEALPAVAARRR